MPKSQELQSEKNKEQINDITFAPNKWLNDREIEWAYQEIAKHSKKKHSFISVFDFLLAEARSDYNANARLFSELARTDVELIFIPVNNPDTHWSLIVYDVKENKFYHFDSSRQKLNEQYIKKFINHYCQHKKASFQDVDERPLQPNADDCGVYLLGFTRLLVENPNSLKTGVPQLDSEKERSDWRNKLQNTTSSKNEQVSEKQKAENKSGKTTNWKRHGKPFLEFTEETTQEWIEKGFSKEEAKKWLDIGLKSKDATCAYWLRAIEEKEEEWILSRGDDEKQLKEEYEKFLEEVIGSSKLSAEVIKKVKVITYWRLSRKKKSLVEKFMSSQKLKERYKKYGLCLECQQPNTGTSFGGANWCQPCNAQHFQENFDKWTSGSPEIDRLVQKQQLKATNFYEVLEWIPYEKFADIEHIADGGFGKVYKAKWTDGAIKSWNVINNKWERRSESRLSFRLHLISENATNEMHVALKVLNNSQDIMTDFLQEITAHKLFDNMELSKFNSLYITKCYGISQDPVTKNYIIVVDYMKDGNLRHFLRDNYRELKLVDKLNQLSYIADGLEYMHEKNLVHRDFHPGNILSSNDGNHGVSYNKCYITDFGLSRPANETNQGKVYGVLPYVAPEVLQGEEYTQASDIYSLGMIAYEIFSGQSPYFGINYDRSLALQICQGLRPVLDNIMVPQVTKDLIKKCWDSDSLQRPKINELSALLKDWKEERKKDTEFGREWREIEKAENIELSSLLSEFHQQFKGEIREINPDEELGKIKNELFLEFCKQRYRHNRYASLEWKVQKEFSEMLYPPKSSQLDSNPIYTSKLLDFPDLPPSQNNLSQEWQTSILMGLQIKSIEEKINLLKEPLNDELKKLMDNFIQARKKMIKNKEEKKLKVRAGELEEQLEEKGLTEEKIDKIISYCEKLVVLEQQLEKQERLQTQIEIPK